MVINDKKNKIVIGIFKKVGTKLTILLHTQSVHPSVFCIMWPIQCRRKPGDYPRGFRAQGKGDPGQGANLSHGSDANQPTMHVSRLVKKTRVCRQPLERARGTQTTAKV